MKNITLTITNLVALLTTIVINYLSNTGFINGRTMKIVSDDYHNFFTPASFAFSIWGLIYLLLIGFVTYSFFILKAKKESQIIDRVGAWFTVSCLLNSIWVIAWLTDYIGISVVLMILLLLTLLKIVVNVNVALTNPPFRIVAFVWWPFSLYAGWISVALIANIAAYLVKIDWNGWNISPVYWTMIMVIVAGIVNVFMTWKRNMREYALVGVWALIAVAVANRDNGTAIFLVSMGTAAVIATSCLIHGIKNFRGFGNQI